MYSSTVSGRSIRHLIAAPENRILTNLNLPLPYWLLKALFELIRNTKHCISTEKHLLSLEMELLRAEMKLRSVDIELRRVSVIGLGIKQRLRSRESRLLRLNLYGLSPKKHQRSVSIILLRVANGLRFCPETALRHLEPDFLCLKVQRVCSVLDFVILSYSL